MTRTDEAEHWFNAVYEAVQEIPLGSVTTYGHIARLLGYPRRARQVGICLKHLPSNRSNDSDPADENDERGEIYHHFHDDNVPWQRVVNSKGTISHRREDMYMCLCCLLISIDVIAFVRGPGSAARQATALRHEGVRVDQDAMGDFCIDLQRYGWFPDMLPSEEGEESSSESDSAGNGVEDQNGTG